MDIVRRMGHHRAHAQLSAVKVEPPALLPPPRVKVEPYVKGEPYVKVEPPFKVEPPLLDYSPVPDLEVVENVPEPAPLRVPVRRSFVEAVEAFPWIPNPNEGLEILRAFGTC